MRVLITTEALGFLTVADRAAIAAAGGDLSEHDVIADANGAVARRHFGEGIPALKQVPLPERPSQPRPDRRAQRENNRRVSRMVSR